jgi:hypothetical protein
MKFKQQKGKVILRDRRDILRLFDRIAWHLLYNPNRSKMCYVNPLTGQKCVIGQVIDCDIPEIKVSNNSFAKHIFPYTFELKMKSLEQDVIYMLHSLQKVNDDIKYDQNPKLKIDRLKEIYTQYKDLFGKNESKILSKLK